MESKYSMTINYSHEDEGYIGRCPELPGVSVFGTTYLQVAHELWHVIDEVIDCMKEVGDPIPDPITIQNYSSYGKGMYMQGWNDRENDLLFGMARIFPQEDAVDELLKAVDSLSYSDFPDTVRALGKAARKVRNLRNAKTKE